SVASAAALVRHSDRDPHELLLSLRRQIDPAAIPRRASSSAFDFRGLPKSISSSRYWWRVLRPDDVEVCHKAPAGGPDVVIAADLMSFSRLIIWAASVCASWWLAGTRGRRAG